MSYNNGPRIVTNGLILHWDAANSKSYTSGSSTIYDLSGNNYHGTITNVSYVDNFGGVIQMLASNTSLITSTLNLLTSKYTVIGASRYSGASRGRVITAENNWLLGHWNDGTQSYYAGGTIKLDRTLNDTSWRIYAGTGDASVGGTDYYQFYINGNFIIGNTGGSQGPQNIRIGQVYNEISNSQFSFLHVYNRILNTEEIKQNYNTLKSRFNL